MFCIMFTQPSLRCSHDILPSFPALTALNHTVCFWTGQGRLEIVAMVIDRIFLGCIIVCLLGRSASSYLPGYQEWSDKTSPMEAKAFSRDQTSVIWKQSYFISSFDERYPLFRDYLRNTSHLSLNAWHLPLSNRVLSPCIQSGPSAPQYAKLTFGKEAKLMTLTGGSSMQFYPLSNCSMNRRLHFNSNYLQGQKATPIYL